MKNQKPSERIVEICKNNSVDISHVSDMNLATCMLMIQGICDYLDEQHEKNNHCEHKQVKTWDLDTEIMPGITP